MDTNKETVLTNMLKKAIEYINNKIAEEDKKIAEQQAKIDDIISKLNIKSDECQYHPNAKYYPEHCGKVDKEKYDIAFKVLDEQTKIIFDLRKQITEIKNILK